MPMHLIRERIHWLPLLVITSIPMIDYTLPVEHGSGFYNLLTGINPTQGEDHTATHRQEPPIQTLLPDWRRPADRPAENVWPRLRDGFALPAENAPAVQSHLDGLARNPGNVARILQRGRPYLYHILDEITQRGLPTELALIPVVESAFDPFARSPQQAAGLWQFMSGTARDRGLQLGRGYDGRRDVIAATDAALDYLTQLQQRFDGDWLLALAAYNAGGTRVQRAIRHNRSRSRPVDFWHLQLPRETRDYVPKLLALRALIENPDAYDLSLPPVPDAPYFSVVDTGGPLDLAVAAGLAGISVEEIRRLNPALSGQTTRVNGPHTLLIPKACEAAFRTRLARISHRRAR
jgi:membrane-bound lytic murein transglycosylase D